MTKFRWPAAAALALALALALGGCGGGGKGDTGVTGPEVITQEEEATATAEPTANGAADGRGGETVVTVNGQGVPADELRLFMFLQSADDKAAAMDYLLYALVTLDKAKEQGMTLSAEEAAAGMEDVEAIRAMSDQYGLTPFEMTDERLFELMAAGVYSDKLFEQYSRGFTVDEDKFEAEFAGYLKDGAEFYTEVTFSYIFNETLEKAEESLAALEGGMDFEEAVVKFSEDYYEDEGVAVVDLREIAAGDLGAPLLALGVGERSGILDFSGGGYIIINKLTHNLPPEDEIREDFRASYELNAKYEAYAEVVDGWLAAADVEVNQEVYDAFTMY